MPEVVSMTQADQFVSGHSAYECGFYAVSMCSSMVPYAAPLKMTPQQVSDQAQAWYAQYNGDNGSGNMSGMSLEQLYSLLRQVGLHFQSIGCDDHSIETALLQGHPVIVAVPETSVFDTALGHSPYPWTPAGNHVIVLTGIAGNNAWFVRDSANIQAPNTLRPGPRTYDRGRLQYVSATAINPPGVPHMPQVPQGWKDDGTTLVAPNGVYVVNGFRQYVLNNTWNPNNHPVKAEYRMASLEVSNPTVGPGAIQPFLWVVLEWPDAVGHATEMYTGNEYVALMQQNADLRAQLAQQPNLDAVKAFLAAQLVNIDNLAHAQ